VPSFHFLKRRQVEEVKFILGLTFAESAIALEADGFAVVESLDVD
jgi:hypothetical protein